MALLLHRGKLRISLDHDELFQRVADSLIRDVLEAAPAELALEGPEADLWVFQLPVHRLGCVVPDLGMLAEADLALPLAKQVYPFVKGGNPGHDPPAGFRIGDFGFRM
jgi:hypothetical protein